MMKVAAILLAVAAISSARSFEKDIHVAEHVSPVEYGYGHDNVYNFWNLLKYGKTFPHGSEFQGQDLPYFYGQHGVDSQFYRPYAQYYYGKHFYPTTYEHGVHDYPVNYQHGFSAFPSTWEHKYESYPFEHGVYDKSFYPSTFEHKYPVNYEHGLVGKSMYPSVFEHKSVAPFNWEHNYESYPFNYEHGFSGKNVYPSTFEHKYESYPFFNYLLKSGIHSQWYPHSNMESQVPYTGEFNGPYSYHNQVPSTHFYGYPSFYNHYNTYPVAGQHVYDVNTPYHFNQYHF